MFALRVERGLEQVDVGQAGNLHWVLKREEQPGERALLRRQRQQVLAVEAHRAAGHAVELAPGEHLRQRGLARAVGPHNGDHLAGGDVEIDAIEHPFAVDFGLQATDLQQRLRRLRLKLGWHLHVCFLFGVSAHAAFEAHAQQLLSLDGEFHRQLFDHFPGEAADDQRHRVLRGNTALHTVKKLVFADARGRRLVLDLRAGVAHFDVGKGVRAAAVADQQRVALRVVARPFGLGQHLDQAAVGVAAPSCGNALGDDGASGVAADVDHLGAGVGLLEMVGQRHRIELADRIVAAQQHARILPGDGRAGFHLRPGNARARAAAFAALGDEVVDAALAVLVAGVPVLHRRVLHPCVVEGDDFHHGGVELVFVAPRRGAAFQVRDLRALVGDDQRALELAAVLGVDAEVG